MSDPPSAPAAGAPSAAALHAARDLLAFIDRSPTPYHAVAESVRRLRAAGFEEASEREVWQLESGARRFVTRNDGSLIALQVGSVSPARGGFRIAGAHTDSPNLRLKPLPDGAAHGYRQLAVEPYGAVLLHTWLDRDLSLAGRVTLREGDTVRTVRVDFARPLLRVPSLAVHLCREIRSEGLKLNPQQHLQPLAGLEGAPPLAELLVEELAAQGAARASPEDVLAFDLMTCDAQPGAIAGVRGELLSAPRLDNLASCHACVSALIGAADGPLPEPTRAVVLHDHEEVGSRSAHGASGSFLADTLQRAVEGYKGGEAQGLSRAIARSMHVSCDMAHAVHPNYADRHDGQHRPVIGRGPVIKVNASQSYASDAETAGFFRSLCLREGVPPQHFVTRSDIACGSTIGPITAARVGVRTVDVGSPMLAMHSCRETAGTADVEPMIRVLRAFFA